MNYSVDRDGPGGQDVGVSDEITIAFAEENLRTVEEDQDVGLFDENEVVKALELVLPLARGYASINDVGSNGKYVAFAESILRSVTEEQYVEPTIKSICDRCDGFGSEKTYLNQAKMALNGKVQGIDWCIHHIVAALNAGGVETVACCCGHGKQDGIISLADGRELIIKQKDK